VPVRTRPITVLASELDILCARARKERITVVMLAGTRRRRNRAFYARRRRAICGPVTDASEANDLQAAADRLGPAPHRRTAGGALPRPCPYALSRKKRRAFFQ
jgi:hypothetical protein